MNLNKIPYSKFKTLWSGSKTISGDIGLSDSVTNYDFIIFKFVSNAETLSGIAVKPQPNEKLPFTFAIANVAGQTTEPFYYKNIPYLTISSTGTSIGVNLTYNVSGLMIGVVGVYGVCI